MLSFAQIKAARKLLEGGADLAQIAPAIGTTIDELQQNISVINPQLPAVTNNGGLVGAVKNCTSGFGNIGNMFGPGNSIIKNVDMSKFKDLGKNIRSTTLIGDPGAKGSVTIGGAANIASGLYQGGKALKGLYENSLKDTDLNDLKQNIYSQMAANPMYSMYIDAADEKTLRQLNNGTNTANNWNGALSGALQGIPKAALSAILGGFTGGPVGAAIGGIGSLANSGIEGFGQSMSNQQSQLQGLYNKLKQADEEYRSMKRPSGLRRAGLQSQYYNQLY